MCYALYFCLFIAGPPACQQVCLLEQRTKHASHIEHRECTLYRVSSIWRGTSTGAHCPLLWDVCFHPKLYDSHAVFFSIKTGRWRHFWSLETCDMFLQETKTGLAVVMLNWAIINCQRDYILIGWQFIDWTLLWRLVESRPHFNFIRSKRRQSLFQIHHKYSTKM